jgi:hypothetical protein
MELLSIYIYEDSVTGTTSIESSLIKASSRIFCFPFSRVSGGRIIQGISGLGHGYFDIFGCECNADSWSLCTAC